ncbi:hypothetical protein KFL_002320120 [Klebsormidium nitens]|uniref:Uncharacterized protein n=1 Tax=Klebsormidium nitens TaxID=105231 RepID=A0A1Y1IBA4_KLENI|nr:hypothetical protein KFL_002320120 [Klebsormidium nitens]|eukprot:GAQ85378.1 hypothetical protein KFL_002320120 [Klebsormidium nitens]
MGLRAGGALRLRLFGQKSFSIEFVTQPWLSTEVLRSFDFSFLGDWGGELHPLKDSGVLLHAKSEAFSCALHLQL